MEEHRDDIGSRFGMWLFIFTELLLFAGLFLTYEGPGILDCIVDDGMLSRSRRVYKLTGADSYDIEQFVGYSLDKPA